LCAVADSGFAEFGLDADIGTTRNLADGHPYLSEGRGNRVFALFEPIPVPIER